MQEEEAHRLFRQIMWSVQSCHQKDIVHLDLKPEKVVVDVSSNVKLIRFGTLLYGAPEIIRGKEYECPLADVWSLGMVLYSVLTGRGPFVASTSRLLKKLIEQGTYNIPSCLQGSLEPHP
ncbi:Hypothetical predicted protein [Marmota monax]|uniref:non-specific serine/threonine protein kinase n=1 Tax=Marmota monax TaxID=9995 RepID=A0A5E4B0W2_MARMO|nr:hypothetical protein GHT09_003642 [Marmota monax]VTJ62686.1 Hypothetical predicted protein [Marmota monax]